MSIGPGGRRALGAVGLIALAVGWVVAAVWLWQTTVPADLTLPRLDPNEYFSERLIDEATSFQRFLDITDILASIALLVVLAVYAVKGAVFVRESAAGRIGTGMLLGMLGLAFVWLAQLPFGAAQLWWARRHDMTEAHYVDWLIESWLVAGGQFLFVSLGLVVVMSLAGVWRRHWWVAAVPVLAAIAFAYAFVQPYLLPGLDRPDDPAIIADAERIAADQGASTPEVRVIETFGSAEAPNAMAMGLGPSERVVLWDTLVDEFDGAEVRSVLAHEIAHLSRGHIWKLVAWMALLAIPIGIVTALATRRRGGLYEPTAVPVAVFVVALLVLAASPLDSSFSQRMEAEADWVALESTENPEAAEAMFVEFTRSALLEPRPPGWRRALSSHPSIIERIEMVEGWRERGGGAGQ